MKLWLKDLRKLEDEELLKVLNNEQKKYNEAFEKYDSARFGERYIREHFNRLLDISHDNLQKINQVIKERGLQ